MEFLDVSHKEISALQPGIPGFAYIALPENHKKNMGSLRWFPMNKKTKHTYIKGTKWFQKGVKFTSIHHHPLALALGKCWYLAILCDLFGMVKWPFSMVKWPPTRGRKGHIESFGTHLCLDFGGDKSSFVIYWCLEVTQQLCWIPTPHGSRARKKNNRPWNKKFNKSYRVKSVWVCLFFVHNRLVKHVVIGKMVVPFGRYP